MIGDQGILKNYKSMSNGGQVTFGDSVMGKFLREGTLNVEGFPKLKSVLHVEGLNDDSVSISQISDLASMLISLLMNAFFLMNMEILF